jgi:hypothetical protein
MNRQEFENKQGKWFNIRLLKYFYMSTTKEEQDMIEDEYTLHFDFPEGRYFIQYGELKSKADEETKLFLQEKNLTMPDFTISGDKYDYKLIKVD